MDINIKYSSDKSLPYSLFQSPYKNSSSYNSKNTNYNSSHSFNSLLLSLSEGFNHFYESLMNIFQEINNNNLAFSNQLLYIHYLLSIIKNKISVNANISSEFQKINIYFEKMNYSKKLLDENILLINNNCNNYHNNFNRVIKSLKQISSNDLYDSPLKSRNNSINKNNKTKKNNNFQNINDFNSCQTSIDREKEDYFRHRLNKNNNNIIYNNRNNSSLNSFEQKKSKRFSYNNEINPFNKEMNSLNKINSSKNYKKYLLPTYDAQKPNRNIKIYNYEPHKISNKEIINYNIEKMNRNCNRCSSVSNIGHNISNIINNFYNDKIDNYNLDNNINNSTMIKKKDSNNILELDLAIKIISFLKLLNKIQEGYKTNDININANKQKLNDLKIYIIELSQNIIKKYNKKDKNIFNDIKYINSKNYEKLLYEYKINLEQNKTLQNENQQLKTKYNQINKKLKIFQQKYNDLLNQNLNNNNVKGLKNQKQIIKRNNSNRDNELLLSKKLTDITKLSHQNSIYLLEMDKLQKEKDSLNIKLEEKDNRIKSLININNELKNKNLQKKENSKLQQNNFLSYSNLEISKISFYLNKERNKLNNIKIESKYFNDIKEKEENIKNLRIKINQINEDNSKLKHEIKIKSNEIEKMNKKIEELNQINISKENKIKELIQKQKDEEKINKEKIDNLINNNEKLMKENENYINIHKNSINEINNQKNTIIELQSKLNKKENNIEYNNNISNNKNSINNSIYHSNNEENNPYNIKEGKDIMTPSFQSLDRNSKNISLDGGNDSVDLINSLNKNNNIINEYESKVKLLKESNNQLTKELNDLKKNKINNDIKKIYKPEEYEIITDKNKDGLKWFLIKNKKFIKDKNSYDNLIWVENDCILELNKYNEFISEQDEINEIIINNIKKLEDKEKIVEEKDKEIRKLTNIIENYENDFSSEEEEPKVNKFKLQSSKSEQTLKNKFNKNNSVNIFNKKLNIGNDFEQNLNDNIKDDYSKNKYFYLEGNGLGLLNNDKNYN